MKIWMGTSLAVTIAKPEDVQVIIQNYVKNTLSLEYN